MKILQVMLLLLPLLVCLVRPLGAQIPPTFVCDPTCGAAKAAADVLWDKDDRTFKVKPPVVVPPPPPPPPPTGRIYLPKNAAELQTAIDAAVCKEEIHLAKTTYAGNFVFPAKECQVVLRASDLTWSSENRRVKASDAQFMPTVKTLNSGPALFFGKGSKNWKVVGLHLPAASTTYTYNVVHIGDLDNVKELPELPDNIVVDRCWIPGDPVYGGRRGVLMKGTNIAVMNSRIEGFFDTGADTQAVGIYGGKGPFLVKNNFLEGAGENVFLSAEAPNLADNIPENALIVGNHCKKRPEWRLKIGQYVLKNLFEIKAARHVVVEHNVFENNWQSGQSGYGILFTARTGKPIPEISDVKFRWNKVVGSANGINVLGKNEEWTTTGTGRVFGLVIEDNLFAGDMGRFLMLLNGIEEVAVRRNTAASIGSSIWLSDYQMGGKIEFTSNLVGRGTYGIHHSGTGEGLASVQAFWRSWAIEGNYFFPPPCCGQPYPVNNLFGASVAGAPTGVGVDQLVLEKALAGVVQE